MVVANETKEWIWKQQQCTMEEQLEQLRKEDIPPELVQVLQAQGRWDPASGSARVTGGNEGAEGEWGVAKQNMKQRCTHRGKATLHSHANALCSIFLAACPGLAHQAVAWGCFWASHLDTTPPLNFFTPKGWSGRGGAALDDTAVHLLLGNSRDLLALSEGVTAATPPCKPNVVVQPTPQKTGRERQVCVDEKKSSESALTQFYISQR